jgi:hypothetical protein
MSERSQVAMVWWGVAFATIYGLTLIFLLRMLPPPDATLSAMEVARWYASRAFEIRLGATISSWTSAAILPLWLVIGMQIARQERRYPVWGALAMVGGAMMSLFLVLPPIFWGVAAFTPDRAPEVTAIMHELGVLTLVTTDQYFIFGWVALVVACLRPQTMPHSPFPRWFGYFNAWLATMFEAGAIAFLTKTGPFSWNGIFPFWIPFCLFGAWICVMTYLLLKSLKAQRQDAIMDTELVLTS